MTSFGFVGQQKFPQKRGMTALRARWVLPMTGPPIRDGVVVIEGDRIARVGEGEAALDLGDVAILPGLINAHCHLDYTILKGQMPQGGDFASWIARIVDLKRGLTPGDYFFSAQRGLEESLRFGTTSILNIESSPEVFLSPPPSALRVWWCLELMDVRDSPEAVVARAAECLDQTSASRVGLSPHAPYTASLGLYREVAALASARGIPFTTHVAETREEFDMFASRSGALHEWLATAGGKSPSPDGMPPFSRLARAQVLPKGAILAHMNHLSEEDWAIFQRGSPDFSVVHCPRCHAWFGRRPPPLERLLRARINVCLGTDSLASNDSLDMFAEMRSMLHAHPQLTPREILHMATVHGARTLGMPGQMGVIQPGALADLVVKRIDPQDPDPERAVLLGDHPPERVMIGGEFA